MLNWVHIERREWLIVVREFFAIKWTWREGKFCYSLVYQGEIFWAIYWLCSTTAKTRQLVVDGRICCCSQFMIFLLELLGPAIGCLAGPSTSNRKIMNWEQQQILPSTTNYLILAVIKMNESNLYKYLVLTTIEN